MLPKTLRVRANAINLIMLTALREPTARVLAEALNIE